ncbi:hypothetical protein K7640_09305 [Micromonospora sp. PLK6-60]|uniref:hypothetical protein n=1 Tax=Micromonospora sp. PLK6-60 TaxID=2873383 RepID=UPI001CA64A39|nr:hypothetical protein [Micromonospora sp. PLK6-60]MBY8872037.1 hypothetical protein [Micromonospora sp. PLK6-60]
MPTTIADRHGRLTVKLTAALYAVTFIHHLYGGLAFSSTERTVLAFVFSGAFAVTYLIYRHALATRWGRRAYWLLVYVFWVGLLGLYEGGWNHTLFAVLRAGGVVNLDRLYAAASDARISDDVFFQATGVLTLLAAVVLGLAPRLVGRRTPIAQTGHEDRAQ